MHFVRAKKHTQEDKTHFASQQSSFVSLEEASLQNTSSGEEKRFRGESSANNSPSTRCNLQRGINKDGFRWAWLEVEKNIDQSTANLQLARFTPKADGRAGSCNLGRMRECL
jgi:hypothetical protein